MVAYRVTAGRDGARPRGTRAMFACEGALNCEGGRRTASGHCRASCDASMGSGAVEIAVWRRGWRAISQGCQADPRAESRRCRLWCCVADARIQQFRSWWKAVEGSRRACCVRGRPGPGRVQGYWGTRGRRLGVVGGGDWRTCWPGVECRRQLNAGGQSRCGSQAKRDGKSLSTDTVWGRACARAGRVGYHAS